jgi:hypothetical protein
MSRRKIFEKQTVDFQTGEIKAISAEYVSDNTERFVMGRTTDGTEWLAGLNNITELRLFLIMIEMARPNQNYLIIFTSYQAKGCADILGVSESMIVKSITKLIKADFLIRLSKSNYLANPLTFYQGGTKELMARNKIYQELKLKQDKKEDLTNL